MKKNIDEAAVTNKGLLEEKDSLKADLEKSKQLYGELEDKFKQLEADYGASKERCAKLQMQVPKKIKGYPLALRHLFAKVGETGQYVDSFKLLPKRNSAGTLRAAISIKHVV